MTYRLVKSWDNRSEVRKNKLRSACVNGRTWTRRVQWLEDVGAPIKLKFNDGERYSETGVPAAFAQTVYDRFRAGLSIEDSVSIFAARARPSRKAGKE